MVALGFILIGLGAHWGSLYLLLREQLLVVNNGQFWVPKQSETNDSSR